MKYGDLKLGVEYAVIPSWEYAEAYKKDVTKVMRRDVAKATLVDLEKYEYKVYRNDSPNDPNFQPAPAGSRMIGILVKSDQWKKPNDPTSTDQYWLSRPQDIICEYSVLETRWNEEERIQKELEEKARRDREEQEQRERQARDRAMRNLNSLRESLISVLGADRASKVQSDVSNRRQASGEYTPVASFTFDDRTLGVLIEKLLEARDAVGY